MDYEQDYVVRLIREMVRMLMRIFFHIDTESPTVDLVENEEQREVMSSLLTMVDEGKIDEAENRLHALVSDQDIACLEMGLIFYAYLNEKDDAFLQEHRYDRAEIKFGVRDFARKFGVSGMEELFVL